LDFAVNAPDRDREDVVDGPRRAGRSAEQPNRAVGQLDRLALSRGGVLSRSWCGASGSTLNVTKPAQPTNPANPAI
jgi:hypothetical protein